MKVFNSELGARISFCSVWCLLFCCTLLCSAGQKHVAYIDCFIDFVNMDDAQRPSLFTYEIFIRAGNWEREGEAWQEE